MHKQKQLTISKKSLICLAAFLSPMLLSLTARAQDLPTDRARNEDATTEEAKSSSSSGEKIFDWSKYPDAKEVPHPFAEKGLIRITKDRTYIYKVDEGEHHQGAIFHAGPYDPSHLANPETGSTFQDNYQQRSTPMFMFDYEWRLFPTSIGKVNYQLGAGAYVAQGHGHFVHPDLNPGLQPLEVLTFVLFPVDAGLVYRMQWWHRQLFVPYVGGGGTVFAFMEVRDDNKGPKFGGSLGAYAFGGVAMNMTYFDALSRIQLEHEYGVNSIYLTLEDREIVSLNKKFDFTSNMLNAGFLVEF